jgi:hypothetical protein
MCTFINSERRCCGPLVNFQITIETWSSNYYIYHPAAHP